MQQINQSHYSSVVQVVNWYGEQKKKGDNNIESIGALSAMLSYGFNIRRKNSINWSIRTDIELLVHFQREMSSRNFNARTKQRRGDFNDRTCNVRPARLHEVGIIEGGWLFRISECFTFSCDIRALWNEAAPHHRLWEINETPSMSMFRHGYDLHSRSTGSWTFTRRKVFLFIWNWSSLYGFTPYKLVNIKRVDCTALVAKLLCTLSVHAKSSMERNW